MHRTLIFIILGLLIVGCAGLGEGESPPTPIIPSATSVPTIVVAPTFTPPPLTVTPTVRPVETPMAGYIARGLDAQLSCEGGLGLVLWAHLDGEVLIEIGPPVGPFFEVRMIRMFICLADGAEQADVEAIYPEFAEDLPKIKTVDPETFASAAQAILFWHLAHAGYLSGYLVTGEETFVVIDIYDFFQPGEVV